MKPVAAQNWSAAFQHGQQQCLRAKHRSASAFRPPVRAVGRTVSISRKRCPACRCQARESVREGAPRVAKDSPVIRAGVGAATAILDLFRGSSNQAGPEGRSTAAGSLEQVLQYLREDFEQHAYFVTGDINEALYDADCLFEEPTIRFSGLTKWQRNLKLLVPFFISPSIDLKRLEIKSRSPPQLQAAWRLRTQLKLPWKPLVDVSGCTDYLINSETMQIVKHAETWDVSPLQAIMQIFRAPQKP